MRIQIFMLGAVIAAMTLFSSAARAECDVQCQGAAMEAGSVAGREMVLDDIGPGGKLGRIVRTQAYLSACGADGKGAALTKLREAREEELTREEANRSAEKKRALSDGFDFEMVSMTVAAREFSIGYFTGTMESALKLVRNKDVRTALCNSANRDADELLFGDKND